MKNLAAFSRAQRRIKNRFVKNNSDCKKVKNQQIIGYCFIDRYHVEAALSEPLTHEHFEQVIDNALALPNFDHYLYLASNHDRGSQCLDIDKLPSNVKIVQASGMISSAKLSKEHKDKLVELYEAHLFFGRSRQIKQIVKLIALANEHHYVDSRYDLKTEAQRYKNLLEGKTTKSLTNEFSYGVGLTFIEIAIDFLYKEHTQPYMFHPLTAYRVILELPQGCPPLRLVSAIRKRARLSIIITCNEFVSYTLLVQDKLIERGVCAQKNDYTKYIATMFERVELILRRDTEVE